MTVIIITSVYRYCTSSVQLDAPRIICPFASSSSLSDNEPARSTPNEEQEDLSQEVGRCCKACMSSLYPVDAPPSTHRATEETESVSCSPVRARLTDPKCFIDPAQGLSPV